MDFGKFIKKKVRDTAISVALAINRAERDVTHDPKQIEINKINYGSQLVNDLMNGEVTQEVEKFVKNNYKWLKQSNDSHLLKNEYDKHGIKREKKEGVILVSNKPDYDEEKEEYIPNINITPPSPKIPSNFSSIEYHKKEKTLHFNTKLTNNLFDEDFKSIEKVTFFYEYSFYVLDIKFLQKIPISGKFVFNVLKEEKKKLWK